MNVKELMTRPAKSCGLESSLEQIASIMKDYDCGIIPIIKEDRTLAGIITDRDICLATAALHQKPSDIKVQNVLGGKVYTCSSEDDVDAALAKMHDYKVRRLPVVDEKQRLIGIISMNDILLGLPRWKGEQSQALSSAKIINAFQAICSHGHAIAAA